MSTTVVAAVVLSISAAFAAYLYTLPEPLRPDQFKGQRVLVTGASSGVGAALAAHYAAMGASLLLTARSERPLRQVAERCRKAGAPLVVALSGDLTDATHRRRLVDEAGRHGGLDQLLLNHAEKLKAAPWLGSEGNLSAMSAIMGANFVSHADLALRAMPLLRAAAGRIGVVSSLDAKAPAPLMAAYGASKAAQHSYFAALRQEMLQSGANVSVTTFLLGAVATDAYVAVHERHFHWIKLLGAASPQDAAREIAAGVWRRQAEVTYPLSAKVQQMLQAVLPEVYEYNWNQVTA